LRPTTATQAGGPWAAPGAFGDGDVVVEDDLQAVVAPFERERDPPGVAVADRDGAVGHREREAPDAYGGDVLAVPPAERDDRGVPQQQFADGEVVEVADERLEVVVELAGGDSGATRSRSSEKDNTGGSPSLPRPVESANRVPARMSFPTSVSEREQG
jgi:hypothetical protein